MWPDIVVLRIENSVARVDTLNARAVTQVPRVGTSIWPDSRFENKKCVARVGTSTARVGALLPRVGTSSRLDIVVLRIGNCVARVGSWTARAGTRLPRVAIGFPWVGFQREFV